MRAWARASLAAIAALGVGCGSESDLPTATLEPAPFMLPPSEYDGYVAAVEADSLEGLAMNSDHVVVARFTEEVESYDVPSIPLTPEEVSLNGSDVLTASYLRFVVEDVLLSEQLRAGDESVVYVSLEPFESMPVGTRLLLFLTDIDPEAARSDVRDRIEEFGTVSYMTNMGASAFAVVGGSIFPVTDASVFIRRPPTAGGSADLVGPDGIALADAREVIVAATGPPQRSSPGTTTSSSD